MHYDFGHELPGIRLGELVASRQYGLILGLIDALPQTSKTRAAMEDDPEYVELVREAFIHQKEEKKDPGQKDKPLMKHWSALKEVEANLTDEIRLLRATVASAAGGKESPKMVARPVTLMMEASESARITKRRINHENLVGKLVPKTKG